MTSTSDNWTQVSSRSRRIVALRKSSVIRRRAARALHGVAATHSPTLRKSPQPQVTLPTVWPRRTLSRSAVWPSVTKRSTSMARGGHPVSLSSTRDLGLLSLQGAERGH